MNPVTNYGFRLDMNPVTNYGFRLDMNPVTHYGFRLDMNPVTNTSTKAWKPIYRNLVLSNNLTHGTE